MSCKPSNIPWEKGRRPLKFQTEPPFESGSDQEKMKDWEMKGPSDPKEDSTIPNVFWQNFGINKISS